MSDARQTQATAPHADFESFCEQITLASVAETVAKLTSAVPSLLTRPTRPKCIGVGSMKSAGVR